MIDVPIAELRDDRSCRLWVERDLHPHGVVCPRCGPSQRRLCRAPGPFPADRCRACNGYDPLPTATGVANTRQRPAPLGLLRRGIAKSEPTARLARELGGSGKQLQTLRQRLQAHRHATAPTGVMTGTALEAAELYQHAGANKPPHRDPADPPRRRAHKRTGHGTSAHDRPPLIRVSSRATGAPRLWVCDHADTRPCSALSAENVPAGGPWLYTAEGQSSRGPSGPCHRPPWQTRVGAR